MSLLELIGTGLGIVGVTLMIRQNVWTWPVGLVQVTVSAWVFYSAKLYSDTILQAFFFGLQVYGWWHWVSGRSATRAELPVTRLRIQARTGWVVAGALATWGWGEFMRRNTDAALPFWDAFILIFSLIAQWLQARKRLENWVVWMVVNIVATGVFWQKDLRAYAALYLVFLGLAVAGHVSWRKSLPEGSRG